VNDLPDGWEWTTLGDIAEVVGGVTKDSKKQADPSLLEVPYLRVANVQRGYLDLQEVTTIRAPESTFQKLRLLPGDILFNEGGDRDKLGRGWVWEGQVPDCIHQNHVFRARIRPDKYDPKFISMYGNSLGRKWFEDNGKQTVNLASISLSTLKALPVPQIPFYTQQRIVAGIEEQFSRIDAGDMALSRARQGLRRMRASTIQAAVTGNLAPQDPNEGTGADTLATVQITRRGKSRRNVTPLATSLPPLPPSWAEAPWASIGYSQNGRAFPSTDYGATGVRLLRPGNLYGSGKVGWTSANTRWLPERYAEDFPGYLVHPGEIVMNLTAQSLKDEFLGRVCMTPPQEEPILLNQRIARLTPVGMNTRFVFYVFKSRIFRRFVDQLNTGSLIQHMFTSQLDQFILPIPPREEQDRIARKIDEIIIFFDYIEDAIIKADKRAPALRAAILEAAFSGRLTMEGA
jgi:type I restriction enzyme, S subunit